MPWTMTLHSVLAVPNALKDDRIYPHHHHARGPMHTTRDGAR